MAFMSSFDISGYGLSAQRLRINLVSANIANANTTRTAEGGPYRRKEAIFKEISHIIMLMVLSVGLCGFHRNEKMWCFKAWSISLWTKRGIRKWCFLMIDMTLVLCTVLLPFRNWSRRVPAIHLIIF